MEAVRLELEEARGSQPRFPPRLCLTGNWRHPHADAFPPSVRHQAGADLELLEPRMNKQNSCHFCGFPFFRPYPREMHPFPHPRG